MEIAPRGHPPLRGMVAALALLLTVIGSAAGCASTGTTHPVPLPFPGATAPGGMPPGETVAGAHATPGRADVEAADTRAIVRTALGFRGVPYRSGGSDPAGFDCSGFVQYVFAQHGLALPREVREQYGVGRPVKLADVREGDLIFFSTVAPGPSHVGMVTTGDAFVHAPSERGVVRVEHFGGGYWAGRVIGARRVR